MIIIIIMTMITTTIIITIIIIIIIIIIMIMITITMMIIDCKTVRIFAYSSTREQSNKRSGMMLKTESETGERR